MKPTMSVEALYSDRYVGLHVYCARITYAVAGRRLVSLGLLSFHDLAEDLGGAGLEDSDQRRETQVVGAGDGIPDDGVAVVQVYDLSFSSRRRHTISLCDWSSDVCSSDLFGKKLHSLLLFTAIIILSFCLTGTGSEAFSQMA